MSGFISSPPIRGIRKKPRVNQTDNNHLGLVLGSEYEKLISIPRSIDDYNHWIIGVDQPDQLIANCRNYIQFRRICMPIMFHAIYLIRVDY